MKNHHFFRVDISEQDVAVDVGYNHETDFVILSIDEDPIYAVNAVGGVFAVIDLEKEVFVKIAQVNCEDYENLSSFYMAMEAIPESLFTDTIRQITTPAKITSERIRKLMDSRQFMINMNNLAGCNYYLWFEVLWFIQLVFNDDHLVLQEMKEKFK